MKLFFKPKPLLIGHPKSVSEKYWSVTALQKSRHASFRYRKSQEPYVRNNNIIGLSGDTVHLLLIKLVNLEPES